MSNSRQLRRGQLPPIPKGSGLLPIDEKRIAHGPQPELLDLVPEGFPPLLGQELPRLDDGLEPAYRRVLARSLALSAGALLITALGAASLSGQPLLADTVWEMPPAQGILLQLFLFAHVAFLAVCSRFVGKLSMGVAAVLLCVYAAGSALEFSFFVPPQALAVAFTCAGLTYGVSSLWAFLRGCDLAHPVTPLLMLPLGGAIVAMVNWMAHTGRHGCMISAVLVIIFTGLLAHYAQEVRDLYQEFDDDNASGWKASVLGAVLLVLNLVNVFLLISTVLTRAGNATRQEE